MRILITRPLDDAIQTARDLAAHKIDALIAPIFDLEYLSPNIPESDYQAVIFTSRHSARHFIRHYPVPPVPAFCVGDETAAALENAAFSTIHSADADMVALHRMITNHLRDKTRPLLRLHAALGHDPLCDWLIRDGYDVTRLELYKTPAINQLSPETITAMQNRALCGVALYSPNAARHFYRLVIQAGLAETCRHMTAWCISDNTKQALDGLSFGHISVADHPSHRFMLQKMVQGRSNNCEINS